jgi:hypothetical protein
MTAITPKQARAFLDRWKLVREAEANELGMNSMELRLRQLGALVGSRQLFDDDPTRERGVMEVRERWAQIRKAFDG